MYVLALVTQKGGSGKSTLAVGLAVAAMENGERVAFVEADPQGTISKWKERRGEPYPRVVRVADPAEIEGRYPPGGWGDLARDHRHRCHEQRAGHARHRQGRSLPDAGASEPGRHGSCDTDAHRHS